MSVETKGPITGTGFFATSVVGSCDASNNNNPITVTYSGQAPAGHLSWKVYENGVEKASAGGPLAGLMSGGTVGLLSAGANIGWSEGNPNTITIKVTASGKFDNVLIPQFSLTLNGSGHLEATGAVDFAICAA